MFDAAGEVGLPVTFTLLVLNSGDPLWPEAMMMVEKANAAGGDITAQVFPRPIGLMIGLELTANPFVLFPSYQEIAHLPLAERVAEMRKPEVRERILADKPGMAPANPLVFLAQTWEWIFPLDERAELRARSVDEHPGPRAGSWGVADGGGLRPAARRRRARDPAGRDGELPRTTRWTPSASSSAATTSSSASATAARTTE